ncbi:Ankyrin repeat-containing protein [Artemisia annua]|uniref:Ankyrin repeat-containing protein n=1 Tax=Artemisia annua TaxID=35608 RepID=A0A2U1LWG7_ARTAN|nr:Ankyrin repeat-containing protein [Artemisia annua]
MGYLDLKISRIRAYNRANGRRARMEKLMSKKSAPAIPPSMMSHNSENSRPKPSGMSWKLKAAAENGDVECFITNLEEQISTKQELQLSTILDQTDNRGNTYLHVAAKFGRSDLIGLLMTEFGSELLQVTNKKGDNAFHTAAKAGHLTVLDLLIRHDHELKVLDKNKKGNTPLHEALIHNHQDLVDLLLCGWSWSACSSCYVNNEGKSAFYLSVEAGNVKTFNTMMNLERWNWELSDWDGVLEENLMKGRSLLHAAIFKKDKVMLEEIKVKGIHMLVHVKDENGQNPIEFASRIGFEEGVNIIRNELSKYTIDPTGVVGEVLDHISDTVRSAVWDCRHEKMTKLLGNTMLHQQDMCHHCMDLGLYEAAKKGDVDNFIGALEEYSVEQNSALATIFSQLTPLQNTFLHLASRYKHKDLLWLLIQYLPNLLDRVNSHGNTALHLAAKHGHLDIVKTLVKLRNEKFREGTPLNINDGTFINQGKQAVVENDDRRTPLLLACQHHQKEVIDFFIKEHVEAYYVNTKGTSLIYIATLCGKTNLLKNIFSTVSHYADKNALDAQLTKGKSLLLAAIWSQKIAEILQELAREKPMLLNIKAEHAQKLVHFAESLGFHEGADYLRSEFRLEIVLDSTAAGWIPRQPEDSYSLDAYSLSVVEMFDHKIENIRQLMRQNGRDDRTRKLLCYSSPQHGPQEIKQKEYIGVELYEAAKKADVDSFIGILEKVSQAKHQSLQTILNQSTHIGNTLLHVAASYGNEDVTSFIVFYFRHLLDHKNRKRNTAIYEAAKAGHLGVVDILLRVNKYHQKLYSLKEYDDAYSSSRYEWPVYNCANHCLKPSLVIGGSVEEAYHVNKEGKSGLYLAVEAGMVDIVKTILSNITSDVNVEYIYELLKGKSLVNAAIRRKSTVMLQEILRQIPAQIHMIDEENQTPLFYAVSTGFLEGLNCLLDEFNIDTSQMDSTGFYARLMQNLPDAGRFVNRKGQNILHIAAIFGKDNVVRFILQTPDLEALINEMDDDGNTPLHLATINWHPKVVSCLTWDHRVNLNLVNKDGVTALDAAEEYMQQMTSFQQRLTWSALMSAGAPRARSKDRISSNKHNLSEKDEGYNVDFSKDRVNTLLLVAILIATVAFAAGFTIPGGYNDFEPKQGQATLLPKHMLQTFVICDTIALYSAIMVVVTLIWAQLGDVILVMNALRFALPLLGLSLATMSISFMAGVSLVVGSLTWLAIFVQIFGIFCLTSILALFIPLLFSYPSTSMVLRYITYYPFQLLVLASGGSNGRQIKEQ